MKLSQIEQILEVARVGSISKAAVNLYISQPNLSLAIKRFESELGGQIFERTSTGVRLTRLGRNFVERAQTVVFQINEIEKMCRLDLENPLLELRIASVGYRFLDITISNIIKKYKNNSMKLKLLDSLGPKLLNDVAEDRAELGFCTIYDFMKKDQMQRIVSSGLEYHSLGPLRTGIFVGRTNSRFSDKDQWVDFDKLKNMSVISIAKREFSPQKILEFLQKKINIDLCNLIQIEVGNFNMMRNYVNLLDAYAVSSYADVNYGEDKYYSDLRFIPFEPGTLAAEVGWIQKDNSVRSVLANELVGTLQLLFSASGNNVTGC